MQFAVNGGWAGSKAEVSGGGGHVTCPPWTDYFLPTLARLRQGRMSEVINSIATLH